MVYQNDMVSRISIVLVRFCYAMVESYIPDDVARFVLDNIYSVAHLEALLLLRGKRDQEWSVGALAARLYISEDQTAELVIVLRAQGFVTAKAQEPASFQYEPASTALNNMLERLAEIYAKHLVPVTNLIHSKPKPRIQEFADAFRLRKGE
jgi:hypothetical protein